MSQKILFKYPRNKKSILINFYFSTARLRDRFLKVSCLIYQSVGNLSYTQYKSHTLKTHPSPLLFVSHREANIIICSFIGDKTVLEMCNECDKKYWMRESICLENWICLGRLNRISFYFSHNTNYSSASDNKKQLHKKYMKKRGRKTFFYYLHSQ